MMKLSKNALGMLISKYNSVLKNMRFKVPALLAACCLLVGAPSPTAAYDITYIGNGSRLQTVPNWLGLGGGSTNLLFPGTTATPGYAGNTIIVNYIPGGSLVNPNYVFGGLSLNNSVTGNSVTIKNGLVNYEVFGGLSFTGNATGNSVTVSGGVIGDGALGGGGVYGGLSGGGNAINNSVTVSDGVIGDSTLGIGDVYGGFSGGGNAINNSVTISGGVIGDSTLGSGFVFGGLSGGGNATGNSVTISGGKVGGFVYGGFSGDGSATGNSVTVSGGVIGDGALGSGGVYGGISGGGNATNNSVTISGGTVSGGTIGGLSNNGNATNNNVTISGGTVGNGVYGGYSDVGNATYNSVTISGSPDLTNSQLFGGFSQNNGDAFTGNTLNVYGYRGTTVQSINNFQNYDFYLPASMKSGDTLLAVGNWLPNFSGSGNITVPGVGIQGGGTPLKIGDTVTLIASNGILLPNNILPITNVSGLKGVSLLYDFKLDMGITTPTALTATVTGRQVNPQTKAFSEGRSASMGFLNQGADLASGEAIADANLKTGQSGNGTAAFGSLSYGSSRYKTGSHADVDGISLLTGFASKSNSESGSLLKGIFLEAGWGDYDSHNSFTNMPSINGNGDVSYYGLGALLRRDLNNGNYIEGSLRGGKSKATFNSGDFKNYLGQTQTSYTSSPAYYGAHLGIGRAKTKGAQTVDYYAKYFWTHQNGDDVNIAGDPVNFSASDSHRLRGGVRLTKERPGGKMATYAGLAYEYELDGKADATVYGLDINAPSLKGGTGIVELGMNYKNRPESMNTLYLSLQGYAGKRQGLSGSVQFKRVF